MNSAPPSHDIHRNSIVATSPDSLSITKRPMTEEEFMFFFQLSKYVDSKQKQTPLTIEEEIDRWIELSNGCARRNISEKREWKNDIFMYNFFQRRGSRNRASKYLQKIENSKSEKLNLLSRKFESSNQNMYRCLSKELMRKTSSYEEILR